MQDFAKKTADSLRNIAKAYDKGEKGVADFGTTIYDMTGDAVYQIDEMGNVIDYTTGEIVGRYDAGTGVMVTKTGELIGVLDELSTKFFDASGDLAGYSEVAGTSMDDLGVSMDGLTAGMGGVDSSLQTLIDTIIGADFSLDTTGFDASVGKMMQQFAMIQVAVLALQLLMKTTFAGGLTGAAAGAAGAGGALGEALGAVTAAGTAVTVPSWLSQLLTEIAPVMGATYLAGQYAEWEERPEYKEPEAARVMRELEDPLTGFLDTLTRYVKFQPTPYWGIRAGGQLGGIIRKAGLLNVHEAEIIRPAGWDREAREPSVQYITVNTTIPIESITSDMDLDMVRDTVNRGIAEALRRRRP